MLVVPTAGLAFSVAVPLAYVASVEPKLLPLQSSSVATYRTLFRENFRFVCASLRRLGVRDSDIEDAAQEVFVVLYRKMADLDLTKSVRPWLMAICVNVARAQHRWLRRRASNVDHMDVDSYPVQDQRPLPDEHLALREDHALMIEALDRLDFDRASVFVMHTFGGCSVSDIAETLSLPTNTVYSRLRLAREDFERAVHRLRLARREA